MQVFTRILSQCHHQVTMEDFYIWQKVLVNKESVMFKSYRSLDHLFTKLVNTNPFKENITPHKYVENDVIIDIYKWIAGHSISIY